MRHLIETRLENQRLSLPEPLETRYRQEIGAVPGWYLQSWLMVFIAFNFASTWMDIDAFGLEGAVIPFALTVGLYVPVGLVSIFACRGPLSQSKAAVVAATNAIVDMAIILNSARMAPSAKVDTYLILAALVPFAVGTIVTIPFRHAVVFYGTSFVLYGVAAFTPPLSARLEEGIPLLCAALILVPLKISYSREKDSKRAYLLTLLGRAQADELRAANERLTVLSGTDPLTGLPNRRSLSRDLEKAWAEAQSTRSWLGVILIDIDWFKLFNDTHGHAEGDRCLVDVGRAMNDVIVGAGGVMGRHGGEEFVAYLPSTPPDRATEVGAQLLDAVRNLAIQHRGLPGEQRVTVSIGITAGDGADTTRAVTIADLLAKADEALYAAKRAGRDGLASNAGSSERREHDIAA